MTAVVFLADGFEEVEAITVIDYLRRAKVDVKTVAVTTKTMKKDDVVVASHNLKVFADLTFAQFEKETENSLPDLVYVPGGMNGSKNNAENEKVLAFLKKCFDAKKIVSAICAAPALVLSKTDILMGKKWTCYPEMETEAGSDVLKNSCHTKNVPFVTDENLVTGRGAGCTEQLAIELIRLLCGKEMAEHVRQSTVQR